jgi:hypothetical protein
MDHRYPVMASMHASLQLWEGLSKEFPLRAIQEQPNHLLRGEDGDMSSALDA